LKVVKTSKELELLLLPLRQNDKKIGFVPTMGALHEGHISLLRKALLENELVICSVFVNPTQFNDPKDLEKYPRPIEKDIELLEQAGCHYLFLPEVEDIYADGNQWEHSFGKIENTWEGAMRPGHFKGVGQVVYKLFNIVNPTNAYFGQKDFQQTLIIKRLIADFQLNINLHICPIIREESGLAMSSRNSRLTTEERKNAGLVFKSLETTRLSIQAGETDLGKLKSQALDILLTIPNIKIEYVDIVNPENLEIIQNIDIETPLLMIIAVRLGNTRLIDNMYLRA
jgi:pantoate--beta-alanine ligase